MHFLRSAARELEGLGELIDRVARLRVTQGVVVDVNPIWRAAYALEQAALNPRVMIEPWELGVATGRWGFIDALVSTQWPEDVPDLSWWNVAVEIGTQELFGRRPVQTPLLVKLIARPATDAELREQRRALVQLAANAPFPALVETRPAARLALKCGDPCVTPQGAHGTVGGFLRDRLSNRTFAATCGHVVSSGAVDVEGIAIGACSLAQSPMKRKPGQLCERGDPAINRLDLALIDVTGTPVVNLASGIAGLVHSGEEVTVSGGQTHSHRYEVGGASMLHEIDGVCFDNLFEVRPPAPGGLFSPRLRSLAAVVPAEGDSGAWVVRANAPDWCGVVVATDYLMGYALEADIVIAEANAAFFTDLVLA